MCCSPPRPPDWIRWDTPSRRLEEITTWQKPFTFSASISRRMDWGVRQGPASGLSSPGQPLAASFPLFSPLYHSNLPEAQLRSHQSLALESCVAPHHLWPPFLVDQSKLFMTMTHTSHHPANLHTVPLQALPHQPDPLPASYITPGPAQLGCHLQIPTPNPEQNETAPLHGQTICF